MTHRSACIVFSLSALLFASSAPRGFTQGDDKELAKAKAAIKELEAAAKQRALKIDQLETAVRKLTAENQTAENKIKNLEAIVDQRNQQVLQLKEAAATNQKADQTMIAALKREIDKLTSETRELEGAVRGNVIHALYFKQKKDVAANQMETFLASAPKVFGKLPGIRALWVGKPSPRGADSAGYDVAVIAVFDDDAALRTLQNNPFYARYMEALGRIWDTTTFNVVRD